MKKNLSIYLSIYLSFVVINCFAADVAEESIRLSESTSPTASASLTPEQQELKDRMIAAAQQAQDQAAKNYAIDKKQKNKIQKKYKQGLLELQPVQKSTIQETIENLLSHIGIGDFAKAKATAATIGKNRWLEKLYAAQSNKDGTTSYVLTDYGKMFFREALKPLSTKQRITILQTMSDNDRDMITTTTDDMPMLIDALNTIVPDSDQFLYDAKNHIVNSVNYMNTSAYVEEFLKHINSCFSRYGVRTGVMIKNLPDNINPEEEQALKIEFSLYYNIENNHMKEFVNFLNVLPNDSARIKVLQGCVDYANNLSSVNPEIKKNVIFLEDDLTSVDTVDFEKLTRADLLAKFVKKCGFSYDPKTKTVSD